MKARAASNLPERPDRERIERELDRLGLDKTEQTIRRVAALVEARYRQASQAPVDPSHSEASSRPKALTLARPQPPTSPSHTSMDVAARNLATPKKARNAPPPRLPHPWEYPGERPGQPPVPKWNYWQPDIIARMRVSAQRVFDRIPTEIYKFGQRKQAALIRDWLADPKDASFLREVAHRLVFRIVCTLRRQRKTEHQTETLAALALDDTIASIQAEQPEYSEFVKRELADHRNAYARLAQELVYLCKDNYLEEDQT